MVFTVLAAVDLGGKCNFELAFPSVPTISELREMIDEVMSAEAALRRPPHMGAFRVHRAQVFDERMEMWVDLVASSQLEDYCQVYVFQKETAYHKDTPGRIPPPVRPVGHESPQYRRSASPPPYEAYSAPLYSDLEGSPYSALGSPKKYRDDLASSPMSMNNSPVSMNSPGKDTTSHSDKVRMVYEELDQRRVRAVSAEDWADAFIRLRLSGNDGQRLSDATVDDLFHKKADRNEDSVVSFPEFQHFAELYPKLLESMYFRSRRIHQETLRKDKIKQQYDQLDDCEKRLDDARQASLDAEGETLTAQQRVEQIDAEVQKAKEAEEDAAKKKQDAHGDSEHCRGKVKEARIADQQAKDAIKKRDSQIRQAQRGVENAEKKRQGQKQELEKLEKELEALKRRVKEKEREIEKQEDLVSQADDDVDKAKAKERDFEDDDLEEDQKKTDKEHREAEEDLKAALNAENERAAEHRNAQRNTSQLQQQKAMIEKEAAGAKMKDQQRKTQEQRAQKAVEDQRRAIDNCEAREAENDSKRDEQEEKENDLLQMEVRLREQREAVERKEEHLRSAHRDFSNESGRNSPPNGNSTYA